MAGSICGDEPHSLQEKSYLCWLLGLEEHFLCCNLCQVLKLWYSPPFRKVGDEALPPSSLRAWECVLLQKSLCFLLSPLKGVGRVFSNMQASSHSPSPLSYTGRNEGAPSIDCSQKCTTKDWNEETAHLGFQWSPFLSGYDSTPIWVYGLSGWALRIWTRIEFSTRMKGGRARV